MRTIGLLGGMSWESTAYYYHEINREVSKRVGGLHSAPLLIVSVDFAEIASMQQNQQWDEAGRYLATRARLLENAGAEVLLLCTNTMHRVFDSISDAINIPALHIADGTAAALIRDGVRRVALLGTRYTMEQDFYIGRLMDSGLDVIVPDEPDRKIVHDIIYAELCQGIIKPESRQEYVRIIDELKDAGAEAVILGCTEIGLLIKGDSCNLPVYDTTLIHAHSAVDWSLSDASL
jgi:aspartate racemase